MPLILKILLLIYTFYIKQIIGNELCWNNENECNIKTELFKNLEFSQGLTMQIDCRYNLEENIDNNNAQDDYLNSKDKENDFQTSTKNRFMGIQAVMLDGCQTPLNTHTYGLEFLPICTNITKVSLRHFNMDILKPLHCPADNTQLQLEYLNIQFNEISTIDVNSFSLNYPQLRDVHIEKNSLKLIHKDAFTTIRSLENLYIVNEPVLMLKFPDIFEYTSVASVHLEALKQMTSGIFNRLPETLQNLYVANTPIDNEAVVLLKNSLVLRNLTIKNCALKKFTLYDVHSTVKRIDLSGNVMKTFTAYENSLTELNLSNNQLEWLPFEWFKNLTNLERLLLTGNHIKFLHLANLLKSIPNVQLFDLSQNHLQSLHGYDNDIEASTLSQVRLKCDLNPWDCLWLHEFAHYHPEKFRILQYEKYISKINVNGLQCIPAEKTPTAAVNASPTDNTAITTPDHFLNVSTYTLVYGSPWEFKRNQRAEALIIVFMLPLGIAFLFLLLYMWIYCQKMFHLSYYKGFSCMQTPPANHPSQRFDVVRQLPQRPLPAETQRLRPLTQICDENEMGYEVPLNGIVSECNCVLQHNDETAAKCQKSVHITYEQLPTEEPPSQIYEEIIQVDGAVHNKGTYDHLQFK